MSMETAAFIIPMVALFIAFSVTHFRLMNEQRESAIAKSDKVFAERQQRIYEQELENANNRILALRRELNALQSAERGESSRTDPASLEQELRNNMISRNEALISVVQQTRNALKNKESKRPVKRKSTKKEEPLPVQKPSNDLDFLFEGDKK